MAQGCPTFVLKDVLFETVGAELVPRRSLVPIIAWLCAGNERWNGEVRDWVLKSAPEMHLEYGDPGALSLEFRRELLRAWVESTAGHARKLTERSKDRYTIPQEEEIDQEQRPDLRAENPKTNPVSIELKWADNGAIARLVTGLEEQLVGQYMRARNSRFGIYVVANQTRNRHWNGPNGESLGFAELIAYLTSVADECREKNGGVEGLRVIGIDFSRPQ